MQIVIVGAGGVGSVYGSKLSARHEVTLVARADFARAVQERGLQIEGQHAGIFPVKATARLEALQPGALILVTTKVNDSAAAMAPIVPLLDPSVTILCVQNGIYSERIVRGLVGDRATTLRAITQFGGTIRAPGVVVDTVGGYTLIEDHGRAQALAEVLTECGLDGRVTPEIKREMWRKAIFNCVINPITAIVGAPVGGIAAPGLVPLKRLVIDECVAVARADGIEFDVDFLAVIDEIYGALTNIASMRQDLMRGRRTEIDYLNGAVASLGEQYGIDCPVNRALTAIVKGLEAQG
ncbi:MAG: ketopantoate reductase family protein [Vicinamibacterales bacterium]